MSELFSVTAEIRTYFKEHYSNSSESLQDVLFVLKQRGVSQMQSVKLLIEELKLSLNDADQLVLNSRAWTDEFEENVIIRENFFNTLFQEAKK